MSTRDDNQAPFDWAPGVTDFTESKRLYQLLVNLFSHAEFYTSAIELDGISGIEWGQQMRKLLEERGFRFLEEL